MSAGFCVLAVECSNRSLPYIIVKNKKKKKTVKVSRACFNCSKPFTAIFSSASSRNISVCLVFNANRITSR